MLSYMAAAARRSPRSDIDVNIAYIHVGIFLPGLFKQAVTALAAAETGFHSSIEFVHIFLFFFSFFFFFFFFFFVFFFFFFIILF